MSVADELVSIPSGARFCRADLHIHSYGGSHDVKDPTMTPQGIVTTALNEDVSVIALTDHNEISNVQEALAAAVGKPLLVVPGVELSTPQGHLLVYFDAYEHLERFHGKLSFGDRGTQTSRCQTGILECLKAIDGAHGFAVLAHVDGNGGFEKTLSGFPPYKGDVLASPSLLGLELKEATSVVSYGASDPEQQRVQLGNKRIGALGLGDKQYLARVLFSDAHSIATLGRNAQGNRKLTRIKMDSPSFNGIRIALQDADARIRLEDEIPQSVPFILGIKLEGGFLDGQAVHFSRNLNCIIGGRGAGKSTVFEAARVIAPKASSSKLVDSEVWPEKITVVWVDQAGQQHTVERLIGEESQNADDPILGSTSFPIESYSQSETAETSTKAQDNPAILLQYLDHFVDLGELSAREESARDELLANQTELEKAQTQVARIPDFRKLLASAQQQLKALESANAAEVVALERKIAEERTIRESIEKRVTDLRAEVSSSSIDEILGDIQGAAKAEDLRVGAAEFKVIAQLASDFASQSRKNHQLLETKAVALTADVKKQIELWRQRERAFLADIDQKKKDLLGQGIKLDSMYIKKLAADESSHSKNLKLLAEWEKRLLKLRAERRDLLKARLEWRAAISKERLAFSTKANAILKNALTDLSVNIKFISGAHSPEAEEIIKDALNWRTSQVPRAALLVEQVPIPQLLSAIQKNNPLPIQQVTASDGARPFNHTDALEVLKVLGQSPHIYRLERCLFDDRPKITVTKKVIQRNGTVQYQSKDFSKLSLGQQQSVLLALMLSSESTSPLIIDQPEDNLDGEFIFHSIVPVLRAAKERRQIIVVTHNPNIAVLGDAEEIIALKSTNDKSMVVTRGSIDETNTKKIVCQILEGAEAAFRRRAKMYGI